MQLSFSYDKKKVIQALRYHFISRPEIRTLIILVNVFAIVAAILFYTKKISPGPFLLSSLLWILLMVSFWFILPFSIYRRSATFKEAFIIFFYDHHVRLESMRGFVDWNWNEFSHFIESPHFFHLYFSPKSFFLVPKENMDTAFETDLRGNLQRKITRK